MTNQDDVTPLLVQNAVRFIGQRDRAKNGTALQWQFIRHQNRLRSVRHNSFVFTLADNLAPITYALSRQSLPEILFKIVPIFDTYRQSHQIVMDTAAQPLLRRERRMCHAGGIAN